MPIALLFDASAYDEHWNYWWATREVVFSTGLIQASGRHMRLSIGDIHTGFETGVDHKKLFSALFLHSRWRHLIEDRLLRAFYHSNIFGMVFENMPYQLAEELHNAITEEAGYLGVVEVDYQFGQHLVHYRVPEMYRLAGTVCRSFLIMGEEDDKDEYDLEEMKRFGYMDIGWEDRGAHQTIFDNFDTPEHFKRVAIFRDNISNYLNGGKDAASEITMMLSDLNPRLFNTLGAAFERIVDADTEEEVAQAALSGRRYLEQLADVLFPAMENLRHGRSVGPSEYRNRLWAFIEDNTNHDAARLKVLGGEVDRLTDELNGGLHGDRQQERILEALSGAAELTLELLLLDPESARKPYYAFENEIRNFLLEISSKRCDRS